MLRILKILFYFSAILFIGKPFLGFSLLDRNQEQEVTNLLVGKLFSKRKHDYIEEDLSESAALYQRLSRPPVEPILTFLGYLALLFSALVVKVRLTTAMLLGIQVRLPGRGDTYLHTMTFRI
ncbi:hypothetical protein D3C87_472390 [compost metagenome]